MLEAMQSWPPKQSDSSEHRVGPFILDGNSVLCQCPTCGSPMSVRLWLLEAECWQCGTRIEISAAQRAAIEEILERKRETPSAALSQSSIPAPKQVTRATPKTTKPLTVSIDGKTIRLDPGPIAPPVQSTSIMAPPVQWSRAAPRPAVPLLKRIVDWLDDAPSWLMSLLFHLLLLLALAILSIEEEDDRGIVLSLTVSADREEGDIVSLIAEERSFEVPLPDHLNPDDPEDQGTIRQAKELAGEIAQENYAQGFRPEALRSLLEQVHQPYETTHGLVARDVRMRREMLHQQGGTLLTEAAVARALRWMADHQRSDGSWRLDAPSYDPGRGTLRSNPAATALALLPFLGAGQTHQSGLYRQQVESGLEYLLSLQTENGDLRGGTRGEAGMYVHGQATIVLCEAYALTRDEALLGPVQRAISFIAKAQHREGGWRYEPKMEGDTSVLGWQVMALQSAKMAGFDVPETRLQKANEFLDSVSTNNGATYGYMPGHAPTPNMTAEALLCRMYLGATPKNAALRRGLRLLMRDYPPSMDHVDFYYWYYATQAFHHVGGESWEQWNSRLRDILVSKQVASGKHAGSWEVEGHLADSGGRLYVTALATCTLEVYYRHLPLFGGRQEKVESRK